MRIPLSLFVTVALLGCGGKKEEEKVGTGSSGEVGTKAAPQGSAAIPANPAGGTLLFVGTSAAGSVAPDKVQGWPRLDSLLPEDARRLGKWASITTTNAAGKVSELQKPFETCRDCVPALFPGDAGVSFGMFDPVELGKRGKPGLREDNVVKVVVTLDEAGMRGGNDHQGGEVIDPAHVKLKITTAKGSTELTGDKLLGIEREAVPGGGGDAKGWKLGVILAAADIKTFKKATLIDASGTAVPIEASEINDSAVPFVKLNRQGSLRFRLYKKQGDGWQSGADLRSVVEIKVE